MRKHYHSIFRVGTTYLCIEKYPPITKSCKCTVIIGNESNIYGTWSGIWKSLMKNPEIMI